MFVNSLITFFYIRYVTYIDGNQLTYNVTEEGRYRITYETPDERYECTGHAELFSGFDPHTMAYDPEKTMDELRLSGPNSDVFSTDNPGAICSRKPTVKFFQYYFS